MAKIKRGFSFIQTELILRIEEAEREREKKERQRKESNTCDVF